MVMSWALINLKPGVGKTTSAVYLAAALAERGIPPLLVDADPGASALRWSDLAGGFDFPVIGLPVADLHKRIPEVVNSREAVVIDVPQMEDHARIARGAMRYAQGWIVPVAPSGVEVDRMARVAREMEDMQSLRNDPADAVVMLNRTNRAAATRTGPDADVRAVLTERGYHVLATQVPHNDSLYRQTFGTPVVAAGTAYEQVAAELLERQTR